MVYSVSINQYPIGSISFFLIGLIFQGVLIIKVIIKCSHTELNAVKYYGGNLRGSFLVCVSNPVGLGRAGTLAVSSIACRELMKAQGLRDSS